MRHGASLVSTVSADRLLRGLSRRRVTRAGVAPASFSSQSPSTGVRATKRSRVASTPRRALDAGADSDLGVASGPAAAVGRARLEEDFEVTAADDADVSSPGRVLGGRTGGATVRTSATFPSGGTGADRVHGRSPASACAPPADRRRRRAMRSRSSSRMPPRSVPIPRAQDRRRPLALDPQVCGSGPCSRHVSSSLAIDARRASVRAVCSSWPAARPARDAGTRRALCAEARLGLAHGAGRTVTQAALAPVTTHGRRAGSGSRPAARRNPRPPAVPVAATPPAASSPSTHSAPR